MIIEIKCRNIESFEFQFAARDPFQGPSTQDFWTRMESEWAHADRKMALQMERDIAVDSAFDAMEEESALEEWYQTREEFDAETGEAEALAEMGF